MPIRRSTNQTPLTPEQQAAADKAYGDLFRRNVGTTHYPWCGAVQEENGQRWCCNREAGHQGEHREYVQREGDAVAARWSAK